MTRVGFFVFVVACGSSAPGSTSTAKSPEMPMTLDAALAGSQRSADNRARDVYRHPKDTLEFFGIKRDSHVVELWPGGGWYTEILAPFLHDAGKLSVASFDPATAGDFKQYAVSYEEKLKSSPYYASVELVHITPPKVLTFGADGSADVVVTFRNLHNWIEGGFAKDVLASAFKVLKPGGVFGVEEHRGDPGEDEKTIKDSGYVPEQLVIDLAQAAGFKLEGRSDVNANPKDDHKHEGGVWALPPRLQNGPKDRDKYIAIGESDRMTLKFAKP